MGYDTNFKGRFYIGPSLKPEHLAYLTAFNGTRRMRRNEDLTAMISDPIRAAVGLPVGIDGGYFVSAPGMCGQGHTSDVVDYNNPPSDQPGLWCKWIPTEDGTALVWDDAEKFYGYVEWLRYLISNFFSRWGYTLNGAVAWSGEEDGDVGVITVLNNFVSVREGHRAIADFEDNVIDAEVIPADQPQLSVKLPTLGSKE